MPEKDLLLGVDVGTTGTKAGLFEIGGKLVASGATGYPTRYLPDRQPSRPVFHRLQTALVPKERT